VGLKVFTQAEFLALWKGLLPEGYTDPIEQSESGLDIPAAHAKMWERVEIAFNVSQQAYYLRYHSTQTGIPASGAVKATGSVLLRRSAPALGEIVVPLGTVIRAVMRDSFGQRLFLGNYLTLEETVFTSGALGPLTVQVEAEFPGYTGDQLPGMLIEFEALGRVTVPGEVASTTTIERTGSPSDFADRFDPQHVGRYVRFVGGTPALVTADQLVPRRIVATFTATDGQLGIEFERPLDVADVGKPVTVEVEELGDLGITIEQPAPIGGGLADSLAAIAADRRVARGVETDEQFRVRLGELADIITPNSHLRILDRIFGSRGIGYQYLETHDVDGLMGFTWHAHAWGHGQVGHVPKPANSELIGQGIVWLTHPRHHRFFLVLLDRVGLGDFGMNWGGTAHVPGHPNAWGRGAWGGGAAGLDALATQAWNELNAARAHGIAFLIMLGD
jgi:hypothetical protein